MAWTVELEAQRDNDGLVARSLSLQEDGSLKLRGHDLGPRVERFFGQPEYEFVRTIPVTQVTLVLKALGAADTLELKDIVEARFAKAGGSVEFEQVVAENGIESEFTNRIGE